MSNVKIVIKSAKLNKKGLAPLWIRVYSNNETTYFSTGFSIPPYGWDEKKLEVKRTVPDFEIINIELKKQLTKALEKFTITTSQDKKLNELKKEYYGKEKVEFIGYADKVVFEYWQDGKVSTHDGCKAVISKFKEYVQGKKVFFQDITPDFLREYELYLKQKHKNSTNTIHRNFRFIRRVFNHARENDVIDHNCYPFHKFRLKLENTKKGFLTKDEIAKIREVELPEGTKMCLHRDMFVFAVYAGGIRISDLLQLRWSDFDGDAIGFTMDKTRHQVSTPLPEQAKRILKQYSSEVSKPDDLIFPAVKDKSSFLDPVSKDRAISNATAYINKNLRFIALKAGIDKKISFHQSRHSFASLALQEGFGIEMVADVLGHRNLRQVMVYAKIVKAEKTKAMKNLNF